MDAKWTAITIICCVAIAAVAHVIVTIVLVRRYRWPFWLSLNFAGFVLCLPMIKGAINVWGLQLQVDAISGTWTAIIVCLALTLGFWLQRRVIQVEQRVLEPDFQEALTDVSEAIHKHRDPIEAGRLRGIPKDTVQAAIHCHTSVKLGEDR